MTKKMDKLSIPERALAVTSVVKPTTKGPKIDANFPIILKSQSIPAEFSEGTIVFKDGSAESLNSTLNTSNGARQK